MKKLLNISVIAALAVLPMAANADPTTGTTGNDAPITTNNAPTYKGAASGDNDGSLATAGYVKGAYNDAIKAVNKVHTTAQAGISGINDKIGDTTSLGNKTLVQAISAAQDAATTAAGVYDNTDSGLEATTVQGAIDEVEARLDTAESDINELNTAVGNNGSAITTLNSNASTSGSVANTVKTTAAGADYNSDTSGLNAETIQAAIDELAGSIGSIEDDFATQDGVVATIKDATVTTAATTGTVSVLATWGNDTATTADVTIPVLSGTVSVDDYNDGQI